MRDKVSYPEPQVHRSENYTKGGTRVMLEFQDEDHFESWKAKVKQEGYMEGVKEGLADLQSDARQIFKRIFGVDLK